jgi:predicted amidohydrolase
MESCSFVLCATQVHTSRSKSVFHLSSNEAKSIDAIPGGGFAAIYAPDGRKLTEDKPSDWEGILYAEIDLGECTLARNMTDPAGHYSRPDIFQLVVHENPVLPVGEREPRKQKAPEGRFGGELDAVVGI